MPPPAPLPPYDASLFLKPLPAAELAFITQFAGAPSGELYRDRQFHKLLKSFVPDCMFHYGRDMPLYDALDILFNHSSVPVQIREGRYVVLAGDQGPYLGGRGFLWLDLQAGLGVGGFFFRPTNGEPTPALNIFSRQVREDALGLSNLPPEFADDLSAWSIGFGLPPLTSRYFITGSNKKLLLEHDEDLCAPVDGVAAPPDVCGQMTADAADIDLTAADYVEQTHHVTNATAWMLSQDQVVWIGMRNNTCGTLANPLVCRIRMTRERIHVITHRPPMRR